MIGYGNNQKQGFAERHTCTTTSACGPVRNMSARSSTDTNFAKQNVAADTTALWSNTPMLTVTVANQLTKSFTSEPLPLNSGYRLADFILSRHQASHVVVAPC